MSDRQNRNIENGAAAASVEAVPPAPWRERADWARGRIVSEPPPMRFAWLFSGICAVSLLLGVVAFPSWGAKIVWAAFHIGILVIATKTPLRLVASHNRYGRAICELASVPVRPGGHLRGLVRTALPPDALPSGVFLARLSCIHIGTAPGFRTGSGASETGRLAPEESCLWTDEKRVRASAPPSGEAGLGAPVRFEIPDDQPCTTLDPPPDRVLWRLELRAALRRSTFLTRFEVPVFDAAPAARASSDRLTAFDEMLASHEVGHEAAELTSSYVTIEPATGAGARFRFGAIRPAGPLTMLKALAYKAFYNSTVTIERNEIQVQWRTLLHQRTVTFSCEELQGIEVNSNATLFTIQLLRDVRGRPDLLEKQRRMAERSEQIRERLVKAGFHDTGDPRSVEQHLAQAGLLEERVQAAYLWNKQEAEWIAARMREVARAQHCRANC